MMDGFKQIGIIERVTTPGAEAITIRKDSIGFSAELVRKLKGQYYGVFINPQTKEILFQFSVVRQKGFRAVNAQSNVLNIGEMFAEVGLVGLPYRFTKLQWVDKFNVLLNTTNLGEGFIRIR